MAINRDPFAGINFSSGVSVPCRWCSMMNDSSREAKAARLIRFRGDLADIRKFLEIDPTASNPPAYNARKFLQLVARYGERAFFDWVLQDNPNLLRDFGGAALAESVRRNYWDQFNGIWRYVGEEGKVEALHAFADKNSSTAKENFEKHLREFRRLIERTDEKGRRALHIAAADNNNVMVDAFLEAGADYNAIDPDKNDAFHLCASFLCFDKTETSLWNRATTDGVDGTNLNARGLSFLTNLIRLDADLNRAAKYLGVAQTINLAPVGAEKNYLHELFLKTDADPQQIRTLCDAFRLKDQHFSQRLVQFDPDTNDIPLVYACRNPHLNADELKTRCTEGQLGRAFAQLISLNKLGSAQLLLGSPENFPFAHAQDRHGKSYLEALFDIYNDHPDQEHLEQIEAIVMVAIDRDDNFSDLLTNQLLARTGNFLANCTPPCKTKFEEKIAKRKQSLLDRARGAAGWVSGSVFGRNNEPGKEPTGATPLLDAKKQGTKNKATVEEQKKGNSLTALARWARSKVGSNNEQERKESVLDWAKSQRNNRPETTSQADASPMGRKRNTPLLAICEGEAAGAGSDSHSVSSKAEEEAAGSGSDSYSDYVEAGEEVAGSGSGSSSGNWARI